MRAAKDDLPIGMEILSILTRREAQWHGPRAGRRPGLHHERTVPRQLDLSCIAGKLMLKSGSLPFPDGSVRR